ncbi:MAG: SIS domain-containing protein [Fidelibacterota bacterium]
MNEHENTVDDLKGIARDLIRLEANELMLASERIDHDVIKAADIILNHTGKIVVCGIGKSGLIGQKIVATLCSTGTRSVFMHAAEAVHGDLGIYKPGDPTILISKSGSTGELLRLIPFLKQFSSPLIGILGNPASAIADKVDVMIDASVEKEADPLGIVPTSSTTLTMAIGDALAAVLMKAREFDHDDFARFHPGGDLGKRLKIQVCDVMHPMTRIAVVHPESDFQRVVGAMTEHPLGAAIVVTNEGQFMGIITEGDIRRCVTENEDTSKILARNIMTTNPITISANARLQEAIALMEERESQISVLPVIKREDSTCKGLIRLHDIYQTRID